MITYTLNETQENNLITFTDIPNIVKVEDDVDVENAQKAYLYFTVSGVNSLPVTGDGQYTIMVEGETISNVTDPANAINKNFYISSAANGDKATALSIARAFRNCPTIAANWNIQQDGNIVKLDERNPIQTDTQSYYSDILSPNWNGKITLQAMDAQNISNLTSAKVMLDIFKSDNDIYVTTLEKTCNLNKVAFNLSPVLTTFAEYGKAIPFKFKLSYLTSWGAYFDVNDKDEDKNYISIGYLCNQGNKYLAKDEFAFAQNMSRGNAWPNQTSTLGTIVNNSLLYIYEPYIPVSFYRGNLGGATVTINYLDSAFNVIGTQTQTWHNTDSSKVLVEKGYVLNASQQYAAYFSNAFYIDFAFGTNIIRYNVIKPLYATEGCQRIYFRNSYGGISFFDFTGKKTETRTLDLQTYNKNIYDFYTDEMNELEKTYNNDVNYEVTLKSHLFEEDGKYIFNDMLQSSKLWTVVNGQTYAIILDNVSVEEIDSNNNIYEATIRFRYSMTPSIL